MWTFFRRKYRKASRTHNNLEISLINPETEVESRGKLDIAEFELQHFDYRYMVKGDEPEEKWNGWLKPSCIPITIILILIVLVVILPLLDDKGDQKKSGSQDGSQHTWNNCTDRCLLTVLETLPSDLNYSLTSVRHVSTIAGWLALVRSSEKTLDIVTTSWDVRPSLLDKEVEILYNELIAAVNERGIHVRIVRNDPFASSPHPYGDTFLDSENVEIQNIDLGKLQGTGLVTTQIWIIDKTHLYIGSSALDWLMVNQMKDIGIIMYNCSCVAEDLQKIFQLYWMLTKTDSSIPKSWPTILETSLNKEFPLSVEVNDTYTQLYISNSPELLCPEGRSSDIDSILDIISKAKLYIYVSVMDYMPITCNHNLRYWSILDGALRQAAIDRRVAIKILVADWNKTHPSMFYFLNSLLALNSTLIHIDVKLFIMPIVTKRPYPSSPRVNRNSFMITERTLYICTFGWSGDNFLNMAGVGLIIDQSQNGTANYQPIKQQFQSVFERDWTSSYAHPLSEVG